VQVGQASPPASPPRPVTPAPVTSDSHGADGWDSF